MIKIHTIKLESDTNACFCDHHISFSRKLEISIEVKKSFNIYTSFHTLSIPNLRHSKTPLKPIFKRKFHPTGRRHLLRTRTRLGRARFRIVMRL